MIVKLIQEQFIINKVNYVYSKFLSRNYIFKRKIFFSVKEADPATRFVTAAAAPSGFVVSGIAAVLTTFYLVYQKLSRRNNGK